MKGWVYHTRVQEYGEKASTLMMVLCEMLKFEKRLTLGIRENPAPVPGTWWWALSSLCYYRGNILSLSLMVRSFKTDPIHNRHGAGLQPGRRFRSQGGVPPPRQAPQCIRSGNLSALVRVTGADSCLLLSNPFYLRSQCFPESQRWYKI